MITFIGDVHNQYYQWLEITQKFERTIQIGDFGMWKRGSEFNAWEHLNSNVVDPSKHKILGGNHEDYRICTKSPFYLGDYGTIEGMFFVRGAYSFNHAGLIEGVEWFPEEELTTSQQFGAFTSYQANKPKVMISHDCPTEVLHFLKEGMIIDSTSTRKMLQSMFDVHVPDIWIFGHHHVSRSFVYKGCHFICLAELETFSYAC